MAVPDPADLFYEIERELEEVRRGYASAFEIAYGPRSSNGSKVQGGDVSNSTHSLALSGAGIKQTMLAVSKEVAKATRRLRAANEELGDGFQAHSGRMEQAGGDASAEGFSAGAVDPEPLQLTAEQKQIRRNEANKPEVREARRMQEKRFRGDTAVLPNDRFGVI